MAASLVPNPISLDEFDRLYAGEKPYYEFWDGQALQKPMPTLLHSLLQLVLINLLREIGLAAAGEVRLKLSPTKQPLPDVIAGARLQHPYPTEPFDVAIEILSPEDTMQRVLRKCRFYAEQGIRHVYVFDPEDRTAQQWNLDKAALEPVAALQIGSRAAINVGAIWSALDQELERVDGLP